MLARARAFVYYFNTERNAVYCVLYVFLFIYIIRYFLLWNPGPLGLGQRPLRSRGLRGPSAGSCGRFPAARAGARRSGPELELGLEALTITGRTR